MALISSRGNKLIKDYISICKNKNKKRGLGKFVIEGALIDD